MLHNEKLKGIQTKNRPSHVIGGGYVDTPPPANKCSANASRASPVGMAWEYAVKGIIYFVHYGKGKSYMRNQSFPHSSPLNTRKGFWFKATTKSKNIKALLHHKAHAYQVHISLHIYNRHEQQFTCKSVFRERRIQSTVYFIAM